MIPLQFALRRRMMMAGGSGAPISELPLGTWINIGTDGGDATPIYEIADISNLVSGGVVLVRKNIYSMSRFGATPRYPNSTLDIFIQNTVFARLPQQLQMKALDVTFSLKNSGEITRKMFALTYSMVGFGAYPDEENIALQLYTSNSHRIKRFDGETANWWLSTDASFKENITVYAVGWDGKYAVKYLNDTEGVVPAFVIPSKTPYDPTPNTDGSYNLIL